MAKDGYDVGKQSTEWDDALVKHGILTRQPKAPTQDAIDTEVMWDEKEKEQRKYQDKTLKELDELEDEIPENALEDLRKKRLNEIKEKSLKEKFGYIKQIGKPEYENEVTKESVNQPVICCLFLPGQEESKIILQCLEKLASKFKSIKIVKIIGNECIENYPDNYCPTLVIYKDGDPVGNIKGLYSFGGKNGISAEVVEWQMAQLGILKTTMEKNPRQFQMKRGKQLNLYNKSTNYDENDDNDNDDDDDDSLDID